MTLRVLTFDCQHTECPTHEKRQCCPTVQHAVDDASLAGPATVMIVGSKPSVDDVEKAAPRPYTNSSANTVLRMVDVIGRPVHYAISQLVRCRSVDDDGNPRDTGVEELEFCREHLIRDIRRVNPKVLILQGLDVAAALAPQAKKLKYGKVITVELAGRSYPAVVTVSPGMGTKHPALLQQMFDGIVKAIDIAEQGELSIHHPARWVVEPKIVYCDTIKAIEDMVEYLLHQTTAVQSCAFDVETKNLNYKHGNSLVMLQFCVDPQDKVWVVPFAYMHGPFLDEDLPDIAKILKRLFVEKPGFGYWLTHNGGFEQAQVMSFITGGKAFRNAPQRDTLGMAYLLDENRVETYKHTKQGLSLKDLTSEFCGRDSYDDDALRERTAGALYKLPPWPTKESPGLVPYAADDVINTQLIYRYMRGYARSVGYWDQLQRLLDGLFSEVYKLFPKIKRNGSFVDLEHLRLLASPDSPILKRMDEIETSFKDLATVQQTNAILARDSSGNQKSLFGDPWIFKITKPEHIRTLFFKTIGLAPIVNKNKKGDGPSVDKAFYEHYAAKHPEVKLMQEFVSLRKLATSYTNNVLGYVDPASTKDGASDCTPDTRVRADFGFTNTATGRPSCTSPNIQNVPRADNTAKASIKSMYCAQQSYGAWRPGKKIERILLQLDYMANEVRWWAILSGDKRLAEILRNGKLARDAYRKNPTEDLRRAAEIAGDIHKQTAALMFGVPVSEVTKEMRQRTKAIVFALIYGGGPSLVAARIGSDNITEVKELCDDFARQFPVGNRWLKKTEHFAYENLYVESPIGRRRRLLQYLTDRGDEQASANRLSRNAPIQGVASDACLLGASIWDRWIEDHDKNWLITNIVHDSCVTEIPIDDLEEAIEQAERCFTVRMMHRMKEIWGVDFICPLEVEFDVGVRWGDMQKWDFSPAHLGTLKDWLRAGGLGSKH